MSALFCVRLEAFNTAQVVSLLQNVPKEGTTTIPPAKPKAGEVYIYKYEDKSKKDDWRSDQYRWCNVGVHLLPKKNPKLKKSYFQLHTPEGPSNRFIKHAYQLVSTDYTKGAVLIHYMGDDDCVTEFPHGNSSEELPRPYYRTCPSVIESLKKSCKSGTVASIYRKHITDVPPATHLAVLQPRNTRQVKNIKSALQRQQRLSSDGLYNLHELALDLPDFIHTIRTHPDLVCVCGNKQLFDEFDRVLILQSPGHQLLSYDTTFQLGDFYLSALSFRHTIFQEDPVIPVGFLLHERKHTSYHIEFFDVCCKLTPALKTMQKPIVTDEEQAYVNAISKCMPGAPHLRCWNHVVQAAERWLRKHWAKSDDLAVYRSDLKELLHLSSKEEYEKQLSSMSEKWSAPFFDYFNNNIHPDIESLARWAIEPYGVYCPFSGITNNQAEGINFVLKQLQEWKEAPVDCMVLALHYLQGYYISEIARGQQNLGNYHLRSEFSNLLAMPLFLPNSTIYSPEEIVLRIKENMLCQPDSISQHADYPNGTDVSSEASIMNLNSQHLSQKERAKHVIEDSKISFDCKLHTFTIMGSTCPHVVTLHPKETCSCPSTTECYHILAAKMAIGKQEDLKRGTLNLTQLRRNSRPKHSKTSGRKRPRPGDCDVTPAPDAMKQSKSVAGGDNDDDTTYTFNNEQIRSPKSTAEQLMSQHFNEISDREMIYLWRISSSSHRVDREDDSYKYIERNDNEILMFFTIDMYLWLLYRKSQKMPSLRREHDYLVATSEDRQNYEEFRELIHSSHYPEFPMPSCPLLLKFMKAKGIPIMLVERFNCELVTNFPSSRINELCDWAQAEITKQSTSIPIDLYNQTDPHPAEVDSMENNINENTSTVTPHATMMHEEVSKSYNEDAPEEIRVQQIPSLKETKTRVNKAAQQAMFKVRQLYIEEQASPVVIDLEEDNLGKSRQKILSGSQKCDKQMEISNILLNETAWLTCTVIDAAQKLLKALPNNHYSGFQSVAVGLTMQFEMLETEFIQILHCNSGHWVTVSTIGCKPSEVMVYDSLYSVASECVQCQIATLLATPLSHITLNFVDVQMQAGTYDCGLFAIAFATALVFGFSPGQYLFEQRSMRKHLWNCLRSQKILMFPYKKERRRKNKVKNSQEVAVHCLCRLPGVTGIRLIECSVCKIWYHANICVTVEKKYYSRDVDWSCPQCLSTIN